MTSPLAGIGWLRNAVNVGGRKPGTLLAAAGLLLLVCLAPSLVTVPVQFLLPGNMSAFIGVMVFSLLVGLALSPVLAGFLQVIDAIERGRPVRALDIFAAYRNGVAGPVILFALVLMGVYIAVFALLTLAAGPEIRGLYADLLTHGVAQEPMVEMPGGFWRAWALAMVLAPLICGLWAIGYGQIAIARRPVSEAFVDGLTGTIKNIVPILVLAVALILCLIVVMIAFVLVVAFVGFIGKLVGAWLSIALIVPLYLGFMLAMYVVMFALGYFFWRDVCAPDAGTTVAEA
jgi:hypothetical protein